MSYALIDNDVIQLCCAVTTGDISVVRLLLETGVNTNGQDKNGETALHTAVFNEHVDIVQELIDSAADVNLANKNGQTAFHLAASCGNSDITRLLLDAHADINLKTKYTEMTALHLASQNDHTEIVRMLVEHGVDIDTLDVINKPAGYYASNSEIQDIFKCERMVFQTENQTNDDNKEVETALMQKYLKLQRVANEDDALQNMSEKFPKEDTVEINIPREKEQSILPTLQNTKPTPATETLMKPISPTQTQTKPAIAIQTTVRPSQVHTNPSPRIKPNLLTTTRQRTQNFRKTRTVQKPAVTFQNKKEQKPALVKFSQQHEKIMQMNVFDRLTRKKRQQKT